MADKKTLIDRYKNSSYEYFRHYDRYKFKLAQIAPHISQNAKVLDIACAKGELIYFLKEIQPNAAYSGIDLSPQLITLARSEPSLSDVQFHTGSAEDFDLGEPFDVVIMSGLLSIFDNIEKPMERFFRHLKPGGKGFIFSMFNKFDIDVRVQFRNNAAGSTKWEKGLNNFSMRTVEATVLKYTNKFQWIPFHLSIDLAPTDNPVDSLTLNTQERGRIVTNGLGIITDYYLLCIER